MCKNIDDSAVVFLHDSDEILYFSIETILRTIGLTNITLTMKINKDDFHILLSISFVSLVDF